MEEWIRGGGEMSGRKGVEEGMEGVEGRSEVMEERMEGEGRGDGDRG